MRELDTLFQGFKSLRMSSPIHVKVTNLSGKQSEFSICPRETVSLLKEKALGSQHCKDIGDYRLVLTRDQRRLHEHQTLEEEGIQENDELVMIRKRDQNDMASQASAKCGAMFKTPDYSTIKLLTTNVPMKQVKPEASRTSMSESTFDFNSELRKILVSLVEAAQLLQSVSHASSAEQGNGKSKNAVEDEVPDAKQEVDPIALKQLVDMGFGENRAKKALIINRMATMIAMDWLLQHEGDPDIDEPVPSGATSSRLRKRREFVPNTTAVSNLRDMGFKDEDIVTALKITGNNQEAACEWLLGERQGSIEDADEGMDTSGQVYTAIMENPLVQLSLANPRILSAFEDMLDNPSVSAHYITDPETGPVIIQISRIVQGFSR